MREMNGRMPVRTVGRCVGLQGHHGLKHRRPEQRRRVQGAHTITAAGGAAVGQGGAVVCRQGGVHGNGCRCAHVFVAGRIVVLRGLSCGGAFRCRHARCRMRVGGAIHQQDQAEQGA